MRLDEFYADPNRRDSEEIALGHGWTSEDDRGATFSLFWVAATGEVYALGSGPVAFGPGTPKPMGIYLPRVENEGPEDREVTVLGRAPRQEVEAVVERAQGSDRTLEWLRQHL